MTSLSVQVARGEISKPPFDNDQAELVFRKGREHEAAYLARLRDEGKTVVEISLEPDFDWDRAAAETEAAIRSGVDVVYQGVLAGGRWRGQADFLERQADGTYEAVDTKLARHAKPAYILQLCFYSEQLARIQGVEPAWIHVLLGSGERQSFRPSEFAAYARRVHARLEAFVEDGRETRPYPCDACGICDFLPLCDAWWDETDSLCRVAGRRPPRDGEARAGRDHDPDRARARDRARRAQRRALRQAPAPGQAPARAARDRRARLRAPPAARRLRLRAPARSLARRPLLRHRGQPVLGRGRKPRVPLGRARRRRRLHAALGPRPPERAGRARGVRRPRPRAPARAPRDARLPLRRLRGLRAAPADGPLRHPRGGGRRPAAPRRPRRPAQGRARRGRRLGAGLRAQGDGGLPRLRPLGGDPRRRHLDRRARALHRDARPGDPRRDRPLQPGGLRRDPAPARLAARAARGGRPDPAARARRAEGGAADQGGARRATGRAARGGPGARRAAPRLPRPRAQARLVGLLRPGRDDPGRARRGRRLDRPARSDRRERAAQAVGRPRVRVPAAGAQAADQHLAVRSGDPQARGRHRRARPRGSAGSSSSAGRASTRCRCPRR